MYAMHESDRNPSDERLLETLQSLPTEFVRRISMIISLKVMRAEIKKLEESYHYKTVDFASISDRKLAKAYGELLKRELTPPGYEAIIRVKTKKNMARIKIEMRENKY